MLTAKYCSISSTTKLVTLINVSDSCLARLRMAFILLASNASSISVTIGPSNMVKR